ncbi:glycoside hydrolase [Pseudomassariella vexata]|uniref:Mannan endo-1,6-alpha-mannosidase n=1 Tax=Pseudomassariella vexata TaxID=1141098 RepID=A0A1Y2DUY3_9PEZI|nr:glycoside hydrolase [Pseudomassariella vexata]ORY63068.1 glycoside hydrolase [Pseudomassariella vexata]
MLVKSIHTAATLASSFAAPKNLDINDAASIRSVASTLAYGTMSLYSGNVTNTEETIAIFPAPVYWWEAGAAWGSMLDYAHYTGDSSYNDVITQALLSQVGPAFDFMVPRHFGDEGNDDQVFWSFGILAAAERNFPQPNVNIPPWLDMAANIWNSMVVRWNTTSCGGGLAWQIFASNPNGMSYKNSVSNGGFFQLSARLARDTGNNTYYEWAQKVWDWSVEVGFIDPNFNVYDGADSTNDCTKVNPLSFSYSQGIYLYGAAVLYNHTDGNKTWRDRTNGLLKAANSYFSPYENATNIMFEHACETVGTCNTDMLSFKAYLSRFMWATTQMMPSTLTDVQTLLNVSAVAAGKACSGGVNGTVCGQKWYTGRYDNNPGLGQQLGALEVVHGLLVQEATPPLKAGGIKHVTGDTAGNPVQTTTPSPTASPTPTRRSTNDAGGLGPAWFLTIAGLLAGLFWKWA